MANTVVIAKLSNPDYLDYEIILVVATDKDEARIAVDEYYRLEWSKANVDIISQYKDYDGFTDAFSEDFETCLVHPLK